MNEVDYKNREVIEFNLLPFEAVLIVMGKNPKQVNNLNCLDLKWIVCMIFSVLKG